MLAGDFTRADVVRMLELAPFLPCQSSHADGCRCSAHYWPPTVAVLRVQTFGPAPDAGELDFTACTGSYVCDCGTCIAERAELHRRSLRARAA